MTRLVLDASAGVELVLDSDRGRSLAAQFPRSAKWWVPEHYFAEVAATFRRLVRRGALPIEMGAALLE